MCRYGIGKQNFEGLRTDRRRAQVTVMQELLPRSIRHTNYSVIKRITNHTSTSQLRFQGYPLGDDLEPTHPFQRITGGASFKVTRDLRRSDVPPACIMDLRAVEGHVEIDGTPIVRLTWTWPGAHMTHGVAAAVEIRGANNRGNIETDFDSFEVMSNVMNGNLCPLPAGFTHDVTIALPRNWQTKAHGDKDFVLKAYLAARVINAHGLKSESPGKLLQSLNFGMLLKFQAKMMNRQ
ncbi:uncharacterized protein LOC142592756 isoform X2 [Dermacentor variabilis]|uniref:uncharacterized protein LOC142592756 isoform X2 n=1 Tax=Dermacentor variabilis TaxID=34621 RepID=UPI003F5CA601